jgi:creatinine amidohydrolase
MRARVRIASFVVCSLLATAAWAQRVERVMLEDLTWPEIAAALNAGKTTIIVPIGGTEQNGPHMVLGKHNVRVHVLAGKIARALGNALVAPVIAYVPEGAIDPPSAHMRFPGTISVPTDAFERLLESAARSFRLDGFRDVVFIGDHGGYQAALKTSAERLNREWLKSPARAHAIVEYYRVTETAYPKALAARGLRADEIGTHAALADTSLALAVDSALVRVDRMQSKPSAEQGTYGDPRRSSAELGQLGVDRIVNETVAAIRKATARR